MKNDPDIIYEDEKILVINKPAGLLVHGDGRSKDQTLADWLVQYRPELKDIGEPEEVNGHIAQRPGIVHRLDRDTSGVMVVAKTPEIFTQLKQTFKNQKVRKTYIAVVRGKIKKERGFIDLPIGMALAGGRRAATVVSRGKKRPAQTAFRVIRRSEEATAVEVFPKTGRTHQIRVHLKALGTPVIGDRLYGGDTDDSVLGIGRLALHSWKLAIPGEEGKMQEFQAPIPREIQQIIDKLPRA